ncbi:MAG: hypothetical protein FWD28_02180 [Treponema sp.]|nr:hypothetical protein [Treponema sp.]
MAMVKFYEGTKVETSLDLENGESVIFVKPPKNLLARVVGSKYWDATVILTNSRMAVIPLPPNKKNMQIESFYYKDIKSIDAIEADDASQASAWASFSIEMKDGGKSSYQEGGQFDIRMEMNLLNFAKSFIAEINVASSKDPNAGIGLAMMEASAKTDASRAHAEATGASHYTAYSPNTAKMQQAARDRAANMDFSKAGHTAVRDYIVDIVSQCAQLANS